MASSVLLRTVQHHTARTRDDEPEQRSEHRIAAVLSTDSVAARATPSSSSWLVSQLTMQATADAPQQVVAPQRLGHRQRMLAQGCAGRGPDKSSTISASQPMPGNRLSSQASSVSGSTARHQAVTHGCASRGQQHR